MATKLVFVYNIVKVPRKANWANSSHEVTDGLVRGSLRLVRDLRHQEVLDELGRVLGGQSSVTGSEGSREVVKKIGVLRSIVGVDGLVGNARETGGSPGHGDQVVLQIALVDDVGDSGGQVNVLLELVHGVAGGGA